MDALYCYFLSLPPCVRIRELARLLPSLEVVAVSEAPSPESNPALLHITRFEGQRKTSRRRSTEVWNLTNTTLHKSCLFSWISSRITKGIQTITQQMNDNCFYEPFAVLPCKGFWLKHALFNISDKHLTTGRINQVNGSVTHESGHDATRREAAMEENIYQETFFLRGAELTDPKHVQLSAQDGWTFFFRTTLY